MNVEMPDFFLALPEIFVLSMVCFILLLGVFLPERQQNATYVLAQLTLIVACLLTLFTFPGEARTTFSGTYVSDGLARVLKGSIYILALGVFLYSRDYLRVRQLFKSEYYVIGLLGVLGAMVMVSGHSLLTIYLGLELMSLSQYALVAFHRDNGTASEAAMKYFILGALSSGMLLYGMSMLYGVSATLDIATLSAFVASHSSDDVILTFGLVFVIVGLGFKLGAVPFHMWIPDVYHGAPTAVTLYLGTLSKLAAFVMVMRLLAEGLGDLQANWRDMLVFLSVLSMGLGNIAAIAQSNIKRMLAYSTISHVGFILLGILAGTANGYAAAMFYTITYALTAAGAFGMVILLSRASFEADRLEDFKGLNERSPWFAFIMLILMFSLAGVPPAVGFYGKLLVLQAVVEAHLVWLAVVAVVFTIIGAFYYLRVVWLMYFEKPQDIQPIVSPRDMRLAISLNGLAVLGLGILPGALLALCVAAIQLR
jgi:proton-translocating NADH-quinone oxidoreductase, chain N